MNHASGESRQARLLLALALLAMPSMVKAYEATFTFTGGAYVHCGGESNGIAPFTLQIVIARGEAPDASTGWSGGGPNHHFYYQNDYTTGVTAIIDVANRHFEVPATLVLIDQRFFFNSDILHVAANDGDLELNGANLTEGGNMFDGLDLETMNSPLDFSHAGTFFLRISLINEQCGWTSYGSLIEPVTLNINYDPDDDGVDEPADLCPDTAEGARVRADGCSVDQVCRVDRDWPNYGQYRACVAHVCSEIRRDKRTRGPSPSDDGPARSRRGGC
jgi:hypothetical protein